MTTAQILRRLRNDKHLSQKDVADALGIDRTTYVKYENGGSIKKNLQELANFYSVSTDYLLGRNNAAKHNAADNPAYLRVGIELQRPDVRHCDRNDPEVNAADKSPEPAE